MIVNNETTAKIASHSIPCANSIENKIWHSSLGWLPNSNKSFQKTEESSKNILPFKKSTIM
jgi:hypothetical protein